MTHHIQTLWPTLIPNHPTIATLKPLSQARHHAVWKITTADHRIFAVKHHLFAPLTRGKPYDLLAVEQRVTSLLQKDGVSVPRIFATCPEHGISVYEWCGHHTLDDYCQHHNPTHIATPVITTLQDLEHSFQKHTPQLTSHIAPGSTPQDTRTAFSETTATLTSLLPDLLKTLTNRAQPNAHPHWHAILQHIEKAPLTLGSTDYNARNIVLSASHQPYVLEWTKIGYDWPERRLIQYTTSLGAHLSTGQIVGLLTPQNATPYAQKAATSRSQSVDQILATLDRHHLIFHLFAALQCLKASTTPDHPWQNIPTRLHNIQKALATPFSSCQSTNHFRHLFQF